MTLVWKPLIPLWMWVCFLLPCIAHSLDIPDMPWPKYVHIPVKNKARPRGLQYHVIEAWKSLNPDYHVMTYDDQEMRDLIVTEYPEFLALYDSLLDPVERVDIWRYLIVHNKGGVYSDADWKPLLPLHQWYNQSRFEYTRVDDDLQDKIAISSQGRFKLMKPDQYPRVILGFEPIPSPYRHVQILQWGFVSVPRHPLFYATVQHIQEFYVDELLQYGYRGDAVSRTGPEPFTWAVLRYLQQQGAQLRWLMNHEFNYRFHDILIVKSDLLQQGPLARHLYDGSWKDDYTSRTTQQRIHWQKQSRQHFQDALSRYNQGLFPGL